MHNKIYTVVGARGQGKTPFIIGGQFEEGMAKKWLKRGMSTLIIDELNHPSYRHIPTLMPKDYKLLSSTQQIYRTLCPLQNMSSLLEKIAVENLVWNSLLVLEDAGKYIPLNIGQTEKTLIGNSKQQNVDMVAMFWNWGEIPPGFLRQTNYLVIFKTSDGPECREQYIRGCFNDCLQAHKLVCSGKAPNGVPYIIVDTGI